MSRMDELLDNVDELEEQSLPILEKIWAAIPRDTKVMVVAIALAKLGANYAAEIGFGPHFLRLVEAYTLLAEHRKHQMHGGCEHCSPKAKAKA